MASTYTDGLAIELIGSGDKAGSWGDITNNNLQALEQGIRGFSTIALTGTATTINLPDGGTVSETTGDARIRSSVVKFTGASGDHTVTLQVGSASGANVKTSFIAINALDSTHSLIIDVGGTDATVPNGYAAHIHIDGTTVKNSFANLAIDKLAFKNAEIISNETDNEILIGADKVILGDGTGDVTLESNGNNNLVVQTGNSNTGSMTIVDGSNGDISITPHGTGKVVMDKVNIGGGEIDGTPIGANSANTGDFTTLAGTTSVTTPLVTNSAAMSITTTGSNGNISLTPNGSGSVVMNSVDIGGGAIDATPIGASSASTGRFTTLVATTSIDVGAIESDTITSTNGTLGLSTTGGNKITLTANSSSIDLISSAISGVNTLSGSETLVVSNSAFTNSAGTLHVGKGTQNGTISPDGTGRLVLTSTSTNTSSAQGAITLSTSTGRINIQTDNSTHSNNLITFRARNGSGHPSNPSAQGFQLVVHGDGAYLHEDGGRYLTFNSSGDGSLSNGFRGINNSTIEFRAKNNSAPAARDTWGRIYHSGMVDGDGAFFISDANLGESSLTASFYGIQAHDLGSTPRIVKAVLKCTTSDNNYDVGDEVDASYLNAWDEGSGVVQEAIALGYDDTNVFVSCLRLSTLQLAHKGGGSSSGINLSNWEIYVYAWK